MKKQCLTTESIQEMQKAKIPLDPNCALLSLSGSIKYRGPINATTVALSKDRPMILVGAITPPSAISPLTYLEALDDRTQISESMALQALDASLPFHYIATLKHLLMNYSSFEYLKTLNTHIQILTRSMEIRNADTHMRKQHWESLEAVIKILERCTLASLTRENLYTLIGDYPEAFLSL